MCHVRARPFQEPLRELLQELWLSYCSSRGMPFREWNFVFREWNFEFRELLREYPGTLPELREWPFPFESVFPEIGVVPRLLNYWEWDVIYYIQNCFRINYVTIFCLMVSLVQLSNIFSPAFFNTFTANFKCKSAVRERGRERKGPPKSSRNFVSEIARFRVQISLRLLRRARAPLWPFLGGGILGQYPAAPCSPCPFVLLLSKHELFHQREWCQCRKGSKQAHEGAH